MDFFGTWCAPCIKALPQLTTLQAKFSDKAAFILISNEDESKLALFISKRTGFSLPVIVDADNGITNAFNPPSYPYTVVLNKEGKILSISNAAALTEEWLTQWLQNNNTALPAGNTVQVQQALPTATNMMTIKESKNPLVQLSQELMYAAKSGDPTSAHIIQLQQLAYEDLKKHLRTDNEKKAFWINVYNGYTQYLLKQNKEAYKSRSCFFKKKQVAIAGKLFSLDDIEHGFLRRSKIKWSLGYLNKWFPSKTEKELRVATPDYRLHFALNCGAESCPPIAFYTPENLDAQLEVATRAYLTGEASYDSAGNTLTLPKLMSWFRRDFGGRKKMKLLAKQLGIVPPDKNPSVMFKAYNWNLYLDYYKN